MMQSLACQRWSAKQAANATQEDLPTPRPGTRSFKVARLIDEAVESGAVRFVIGDQEEYDTELAEALSRQFGLRHVVVVRTNELSASEMTGEWNGVGGDQAATFR